MDVDGLGDEIVDKMIAAGLIHDVADFYQLTVDDIAGLDTGRTYASSNSKKGVKKGDPIPVGLKTAEKIIAELNKSKSQPLGRVLFALGIRHVGKSVGEVIAERFLSIDKLILASEEDIAECEGIGPKIAASVKQFLAVPENLAVLERCAKRACLSRSTWAPLMRKPQLTLAWRASSPTHSRSRV